MMNFTRKVLANGLRVVTCPVESVQSVVVMLGVGVGWRHEHKEVNGIAHFAEHMFFKGSAKRPTAQDIAVTIDSVGGVLNAATMPEATYYYTVVPSQHWRLGWDVISDMILNPLLDASELEKEKGVIAEEINMNYDTPMYYVQEVFQNLLYGDHPLGWDSFGTQESVQSLKRSDFVDFYSRWYQPENMVVVLAGNVGEEALKAVEETFSPQPSHAIDAPLPVPTPPAGPRVKIRFKESDQAHIVLGVPGYSYSHPQRYAASLLATVLGGGMSSRLFNEIREKRGLAYYVTAGNSHYKDAGSLEVSAGLSVDKVLEGVKVIKDELEKVSQGKIPQAELFKAKEYLKGHLVLGVEGSRGAGSFLLLSELFEDSSKTIEEVLASIEAVTLEEVLAVAKDLFPPENLNLAVIGPFPDESLFLEALRV